MRLFLDELSGHENLKNLDGEALTALASELRAVILETVTRNGGHLASNLGVVELTIALHRVFDSPHDKFVWDVGHQCYAHKLLTGRAALFSTLRQKGGLSGFPKRNESEHDAFDTGHASTSISAALGLLAGMSVEERQAGRRAVAIIGDGALTGGLAYEALSHAGQLGLPLIVVLNDNRMSIGPSVGSLSRYLSRLSAKKHYQFFRRTFDNAVKKVPIVGGALFKAVVRLKRAVKAVFYTDNFFVDLGFEYIGPVDGHNIAELERVLRDVRKLETPSVVHVVTRKGKGMEGAERDPLAFHGLDAGASAGSAAKGGSFTLSFQNAVLDAAKRDERVRAVCAAMEKGTGLSAFRAAFPDRFFDVGIAEAHAVTFSAALAAAGLRPVVALYSTFLQRATDQVIHDVALQKLPVIFAVDRAGLVAGDGNTHQGIFDIAIFYHAPHVNILSPALASDMPLMLDWALTQGTPVIIRYPKARALESSLVPPLVQGRGVYLKESAGATCCIAFTGGLYDECLEAARILEEAGVDCALYSLRFLKPLDEDYLLAQVQRFGVFVLAEDGVKCVGGVVEALAKNAGTKVLPLYVKNPAALGCATREELLEEAGLSGRGIAGTVMKA